MAKRFVQWTDTDRKVWSYEFHDYMQIVAQARYVIRKVQRIIDECVRSNGLDPLEHQALIQIYGAAEQKLPIGHLAERLNIVSALASRLVQQLEGAGLVRRTPSLRDRRATYVGTTPKGVARLYAIVEDVHHEVGYVRSKLTPVQRRAAHEIMAFYVGSQRETTAAARRRNGRDLIGMLMPLPKPERGPKPEPKRARGRSPSARPRRFRLLA
jgi:DNA-binding MarR family transcriptional regulator